MENTKNRKIYAVSGGTGNACFHSFRDPDIVHSLECYRQAADFPDEFCASGADLTGIITGAVSESEPLLLPRQQGKLSDSWYLRNVTYADRCRIRGEMLTATLDMFSTLIDPLRELARTGSICVVGSRQQIEACRAQLDTVVTL